MNICGHIIIAILSAMTAVEAPRSQAAADAAIAREGAYGLLQIRQACLTDVNEYAGTSYTLQDVAACPSTSRWVAINYFKRYNARSAEDAARLWNGGPSRRYTDGYWAKVQQHFHQPDCDCSTH